MSEMIERVAKALCESRGGNWADLELYNDTAGWKELARVAIAEMREPTDEMCQYVKPAPGEWEMMIDTALGDNAAMILMELEAAKRSRENG